MIKYFMMFPTKTSRTIIGETSVFSRFNFCTYTDNRCLIPLEGGELITLGYNKVVNPEYLFPDEITIRDDEVTKFYFETDYLKRLFYNSFPKSDSFAVEKKGERLAIWSKGKVWNGASYFDMRDRDLYTTRKLVSDSLEQKIELLNFLMQEFSSGTGTNFVVAPEYFINPYKSLDPYYYNLNSIKRALTVKEAEIVKSKLKITSDDLLLLNQLERFKDSESRSLLSQILLSTIGSNKQRNRTYIIDKDGIGYKYDKMGYFIGDDSFLYDLQLGSSIGAFNIVGKETKLKQQCLALVCADVNQQSRIIFELKNNLQTKFNNVFLISGSIPFDVLDLNLLSSVLNDNAYIVYNDIAFGSYVYQLKREEGNKTVYKQIRGKSQNEGGLIVTRYKILGLKRDDYEIENLRTNQGTN